MKKNTSEDSKKKPGNSGWSQYFTSSLGLVVVGLASGTAATVATIYGAPFVAIGFAATGAIAFNSFVIKDIIRIKQENETSDDNLRKSSEKKLDNIYGEAGEHEGAVKLANLGIGSGVVGILAAASSAVVGSLQQAISQDNNSSSRDAAAVLAVTGGAAILVGFSSSIVLNARAGKLKEVVPKSHVQTGTASSTTELHQKSDALVAPRG